MESLITLNNSTNGRDKVLRVIQFASRLVWATLERNGVKDVSRLKSVEESLSTTRKALQLGRFVDFIYAARQTVKLDNQNHRITLTMSRISYALFLVTDNILWAGRVGLLDVNRAKWFKRGCKFWLYATIMNLIRDAYEIQVILETRRRQRLRRNNADPLDPFIEIIDVLHENPALAVDTLKNSCDACIPLNSLNHIRLSPQAVGLLGVISSLCALLQILEPGLRLHPS